MNSSLLELIRKSKIGTWCKRGAVLVVVLGLIQCASVFFFFWNQFRISSPDNPSPDIFPFLFLSFSLALPTLIMSIFFALFLYAIGVVINTFPAPSREVNEEVSFEEIREVERVPEGEWEVHVEK